MTVDARAAAGHGATPPPRRSPWRVVVSTAVTVGVLAVVFRGIFPKVADYTLIMPVLGVLALLASGVVEGSCLLLAILVLALRGLEAGTGTVTVTWTEALAAFSFARIASFIPITPGGLGTAARRARGGKFTSNR